jgi:two-component system cell cycle response regulator DivK
VPKKNILVADDNSANRELICAILEREGYDVRVAADGHDAIAQFHHATPDLLLLDIHMPGLDGYDVLNAIRQSAPGARVPAVALTAAAMPADEERALSSGFDAYLAKPYEVPDVIALVQRLLEEAA